MQLAEWLEARGYWANVLKELRSVMMQTERAGKTKFTADTGFWIERFAPDCAGGAPGAMTPPAAVNPPGGGGPGRNPRGGPGGGGGGPGGRQPRGGGPGFGRGPNLPGGREETCSTISLLCRGVDLTHLGPNASTAFVYLFDDLLKTNSMFVATNSGIVGNLSPDETTFKAKTFTIQANVTPKRPLRL